LLDPRTGALQWANAGHEPGIILRRTGATVRLGAGGPPLGVFGDVHYHTDSCVIEPGDRLLLVTDGVTEARSPSDEDFGIKRVERMLVEHYNRGVDELVRGLSKAVQLWAIDHSPHDDVTVVALRREDDATLT
jgi:serine phosphatase RsbU (regulator of sigma subunit)